MKIYGLRISYQNGEEKFIGSEDKAVVEFAAIWYRMSIWRDPETGIPSDDSVIDIDYLEAEINTEEQTT